MLVSSGSSLAPIFDSLIARWLGHDAGRSSVHRHLVDRLLASHLAARYAGTSGAHVLSPSGPRHGHDEQAARLVTLGPATAHTAPDPCLSSWVAAGSLLDLPSRARLETRIGRLARGGGATGGVQARIPAA